MVSFVIFAITYDDTFEVNCV